MAKITGMNFEDFLSGPYRTNCNIAWIAGWVAKQRGEPRVCNLEDDEFITPSGNILRVYESAWEQGYDAGTTKEEKHDWMKEGF